MIIKQYPVDHKYAGRRSHTVDTVVVHYISAKNLPGYKDKPYDVDRILAMFKDGIEWGGKTHYVSAHYLVSREGTIYQMVDITDRAWHAGKSRMPDPDCRENVNNFSIGIELSGMEGDKYDDRQYVALAELCECLENDVKNKNLGEIKNYVGHDFISGKTVVALKLRTDKKIDPGPLFDWERFHIDMWTLKNKVLIRKKNKIDPIVVNVVTKKEIPETKMVNDYSFGDLFSALIGKLFKRK